MELRNSPKIQCREIEKRKMWMSLENRLAVSKQVLEGEANEREAVCEGIRVRISLSWKNTMMPQMEEAGRSQSGNDKQKRIRRDPFVNCSSWEIKSLECKRGQQICICKGKKHGVQVLTVLLTGCVIATRSPNRFGPQRTSCHWPMGVGLDNNKSKAKHTGLWEAGNLSREYTWTCFKSLYKR